MSETIKWLESEQVKALLAGITNPRDKAIFTVAYWRGLRASEVGMLKLEDWKPESGRLYVHRAKGGRNAEYLVSDAEKKVLRSWLQGYQIENRSRPLFPSERRGPISRSRLDQLMKFYGRRVGLPEDLCHFHVLRHSIAVKLTDEGKALHFIQDWMGHSNIQSTLVYAQLRNPTRDAGAQEFYGRVEEKKPEPVKWGRKKR